MIATNSGDGAGDVSPDVVAALRHTRRREAVEHLRAEEGKLSLVTLASRLAADTDDALPDVIIELHDLHMPELTGCGLVDYDDDTGAVRLDADPEVVETALDRVRDDP